MASATAQELPQRIARIVGWSLAALALLTSCDSGDDDWSASSNSESEQQIPAPCPNGINVFDRKKAVDEAPRILSGPSAERFDCTVLTWPDASAIAQIPDTSAQDRQYHLAIEYYEQYVDGSRDFATDARAICVLWSGTPKYQPVVNTIEYQGYAKGIENQTVAGSVLSSAITVFCPQYQQDALNQATEIVQDVAKDISDK